MGRVNQSGIIRAVQADNVPDAYETMIRAMRDIWQAKPEMSRNGPVRVARNVHLEILNPRERVLFDPVRNANPFFHIMEFVWMMSGSNNVKWIAQFNKRLWDYAEPESDVHHGAYGHRWRRWFSRDQLIAVRDMLRQDHCSRRAVLAMWDARADLAPHNDLPCNTHIYVAVEDGKLNFTVCNRSNDLIWGMLGANAVHMSLLQELLAYSIDVEVGSYFVYTNNLHMYESLPNFDKVWATKQTFNPYPMTTPPVLREGETMEDFLRECEEFVHSGEYLPTNKWLLDTASPMYDAYMERLEGGKGMHHVKYVDSLDWRIAAAQWVERKELAKDAL